MNALTKEHVTPTRQVQLQVSRYDQVASMLVSLLMLAGVAVFLLAIVWLTKTFTFERLPPIITHGGTQHDSNDGVGFEPAMATPGLDELPELTEPELPAELQAVTDAVSTVAAGPPIDFGHSGVDDGDKPGTPKGDDVPIDTPPEDIVPRWERWQIRWTSTGLKPYIRQLDFFKIELGAAGGKPNVDYAFNLTKDRPDTREGSGGAEKRLYMTWKVGELSKFDKTILARGGIQTAGRVVLQFYPEETEHRLALVELQNAKSEGVTSVKEIRKTFFGVRAKGGGYEFFVEGQQFRPAPHE